MIGRNPGFYWRTCWGILTPLFMVFILLYTLISYKPLTYKGQYYPSTAYGKRTFEYFNILCEFSNAKIVREFADTCFYIHIKWNQKKK